MIRVIAVAACGVITGAFFAPAPEIQKSVGPLENADVKAPRVGLDHLALCDTILACNDSSALATYYDKAQSLTGFEKVVAHNLVIVRWAELDPLAAASYFSKLPHTKEMEALHLLYCAWGHLDPKSAVAEASLIEERSLRRSVMQTMVSELSDKQIECFLRLQLAGADLDLEHVNKIWEFALSDNTPALVRSISLLRADHAKIISSQLVDQLVGSVGATRTAEWVAGLPPSTLRSMAVGQIAPRVAHADIDFTLATFYKMSGWQANETLVSSLAEAMLAQKGVDEALEWLSAVSPGSARIRNAATLVDRYIFRDAEVAQTIVSSANSTSRISMGDLDALYAYFAEKDPKQALKWLRETGLQVDALRRIGRQAAANGALQAQDQLGSLNNLEEKRAFAEGVGEFLGESNPGQAMQFLRDSDITLEDSKALGVIRGLAKSNPEVAANYISQLEDSMYAHPLVVELANNWAAIDPAATADWLLQLGEIPPKAIEGLVRLWVSADPIATSSWVSDLPQGPSRDRSAYEIVRSMMGIDLDTSVEWAAAISDGKTQSRALEFLYINAAGKDHTAAAGKDYTAALLDSVGRHLGEEGIERFMAAVEKSQRTLSVMKALQY